MQNGRSVAWRRYSDSLTASLFCTAAEMEQINGIQPSIFNSVFNQNLIIAPGPLQRRQIKQTFANRYTNSCHFIFSREKKEVDKHWGIIFVNYDARRKHGMPPPKILIDIRIAFPLLLSVCNWKLLYGHIRLLSPLAAGGSGNFFDNLRGR